MTTSVEYGWVYNVLDSVSRCEFWLIADEMRNSDRPLTKLLLEMCSAGVTDDTTRARELIFELGEQCAESADLVQVEGWGGRILSATAAGMVLALAMPADYLRDIAADRNIVRRGFIFPAELPWPITVEPDPEAMAAADRSIGLSTEDELPGDELSCIMWVVCNGVDPDRALAAITAGRFHPEIALAIAVMCAAGGLSRERVIALSGAVTTAFANPADHLTKPGEPGEQQLQLPPIIV